MALDYPTLVISEGMLEVMLCDLVGLNGDWN